jgi:pimeloyl-ACP methyl ester carboxylesterase
MRGPKTARPVVLPHGNPTWSFLCRDSVEPLRAAGYRVVAPDCIGAGYSDKPRIDGAYSLARHIADLVSLIDQLDLEGVALAGQDWGGPQGVRATLTRLDRIAALTLMNTWLFTDYKGRFHTSPCPWTTWHAPIIGPLSSNAGKVLSHGAGSPSIPRRVASGRGGCLWRPLGRSTCLPISNLGDPTGRTCRGLRRLL